MKDTPGSAFNSNLNIPLDAIVISKGTVLEEDGYTAFEGRDQSGASLDNLLKQRQVRSLFIAGVATDYCVKETVLSSLHRGYKTYLLADAVRGVDLNEGDSKEALKKMKESGAVIVDTKDTDSLL